MQRNYIIIKPFKSMGVAILLTVFFGPLGLFYASVGGALLAILSPLIAVWQYEKGMISEGNIDQFLLLYFLLVWPFSIFWSIISVWSYNYRIKKEIREEHEVTCNDFQNQEATSNNFVSDWLKDNPGKSINDYFAKHHD